MNGIDPYAYMQQISMQKDKLTERNEIETVLDVINNKYLPAARVQGRLQNLKRLSGVGGD